MRCASCAPTGTAGGEERVLPVGWLNAMLEEPPGRVPRLLLVAHGVREEIATALGEAEKRDYGWRCAMRCTGCATRASTTRSCEQTGCVRSRPAPST